MEAIEAIESAVSGINWQQGVEMRLRQLEEDSQFTHFKDDIYLPWSQRIEHALGEQKGQSTILLDIYGRIDSRVTQNTVVTNDQEARYQLLNRSFLEKIATLESWMAQNTDKLDRFEQFMKREVEAESD